MLDSEMLQFVVDNHMQKDILQGKFGLEKENNRVDGYGKLALTPHPKAFGSKKENPYIKTDFSESQIEMITPPFETIEETYHFLETLHDIVTLELLDAGEYLWPSSNPPALPKDEEIPIADMNHSEENEYRMKLAEKYGRKRQLMSGIHYNFSFSEAIIHKMYQTRKVKDSYKDFKDSVYLKVARNLLKYRWLLIYLFGASPVFNKTYIDSCVRMSEHFDEESHFFRHMNSLRNSICGYRNAKPLYVSFESTAAYVRDLQDLVQSGDLLSAREYYSFVRIKPGQGRDFMQELLQQGIAYLELRLIDLNPLYKNGISQESMKFIHLFLVYLLLIQDEPFNEGEQRTASLNHESLMIDGIQGMLFGDKEPFVTFGERGLAIIEEMEIMLQVLMPNDSTYTQSIVNAKQKIQNPELGYGAKVKAEIQRSSYLTYHMEKAKQYATESRANGYQFIGYEDLELSTQLLLKAAIKRGIAFEFVDRAENFVLLSKGDRQEYVKQATKTSLDSYSTVLIMENKVVTKKVLERQGIRVPKGKEYRELIHAMADYEVYRDKPIVIKPKSTNFGLGITIFTGEFSREDYRKAFDIAFTYDETVLLEEFITGKEYRFLVMGREVVGILHRVPANVVGDGVHTIEELVREKNKDPLRGQGYRTPLERIQIGETEEMFLKNQSKHRTDIPRPGEVVYLRENSNISTGGDSIDYTDDIQESYKRIALQSAEAAGATFCGVDMMIHQIEEEATETNYSIIEINFNPAIHIHCYPYQGKNRKADEKILDLLFGDI